MDAWYIALRCEIGFFQAVRAAAGPSAGGPALAVWSTVKITVRVDDIWCVGHQAQTLMRLRPP